MLGGCLEQLAICLVGLIASVLIETSFVVGGMIVD
jgi:hypothetical protein